MTSEAFERDFVSDLRRLGIRPGDVLLVHSSLRSLGHVPGGAETAIKGLLKAVGRSGTLLMPALSYAYVSDRQPLFDPNWTGTCVGSIPETFRTFPGVIRSVHPTHSVCAIGAIASDLLAQHHIDSTPVGPNSPFKRLPGIGGKIVMLGCGLRPNTSMHGVEELVAPDYLFREQSINYVICSEIGEQVVTHRRHGFQGWAQRYDRLEGILPGLVSGQVIEAKAFVIDAKEMWAAAHAALSEDPYCFVEKVGDDGRTNAGNTAVTRA